MAIFPNFIYESSRSEKRNSNFTAEVAEDAENCTSMAVFNSGTLGRANKLLTQSSAPTATSAVELLLQSLYCYTLLAFRFSLTGASVSTSVTIRFCSTLCASE